MRPHDFTSRAAHSAGGASANASNGHAPAADGAAPHADSRAPSAAPSRFGDAHVGDFTSRNGWPIVGSRVAATAADETVDVGDLVRQIGRGWRTLLVGALAGAVVALGVLLAVPPWYRATASVLVRNANDPAGSLLSRFGLAGDLAGGVSGGALGSVLKSPLETEVQLLQSRELVGRVVDSLSLQARVLAPGRLPARMLVAPGPIGDTFRRVVVAFTREADGTYRATAGATATRLVPGRPAVVPGVGAVTLAPVPTVLPPAFRIRFEDREDAITRALDHLTIEKLGGEVVKLRYSGPDSLTAADVPNAAISVYLELRRTVDRGLNARRYEFMAAQADTASRQLAIAEDALRREQEASGVVDPELVGKSAFSALQEVRTQFIGIEGERRAAHALVSAVERGALGPRQLIAFPSFLRSPAINAIISQLTQLETERTRTLSARTERDPDVAALTQSIADLERNLLPLARNYAASLDQQTAELNEEQRTVERQLGALPGEAESSLRRQRDVKRLSQVVLGLQAQMIDARLASLGDGGQVRRVDVAIAPKRPLFPRAVWTLPVGVVIGLLGGAVVVLGRSAWSSRVQTVRDAERATRLPAVMMHPGSPLLFDAGDGGTVVVLPTAGAGTMQVADALATQARARGRGTAVVDATSGTSTSGGDPSAADALRSAIRDASATHELVCVAGPPLTSADVAALLDRRYSAVVVAVRGVTTRQSLAAAAATLDRLDIPVLGVVVLSQPRSAAAPSTQRSRTAR